MLRSQCAHCCTEVRKERPALCSAKFANFYICYAIFKYSYLNTFLKCLNSASESCIILRYAIGARNLLVNVVTRHGYAIRFDKKEVVSEKNAYFKNSEKIVDVGRYRECQKCLHLTDFSEMKIPVLSYVGFTAFDQCMAAKTT